jgi:hypothetical protein
MDPEELQIERMRLEERYAERLKIIQSFVPGNLYVYNSVRGMEIDPGTICLYIRPSKRKYSDLVEVLVAGKGVMWLFYYELF